MVGFLVFGLENNSKSDLESEGLLFLGLEGSCFFCFLDEVVFFNGKN